MAIIHKIDANTHMIDAYYAYPGHSAVFLIGDGDEYALVDTGTALGAQYILAALEELSISPKNVRYILPTHVHLDHAGGVGVLAKEMTNAEVHVHPSGHRHLVDPARLVEASRVIYGEEMMDFAVGETIALAEERCHSLEDGQELTLGSSTKIKVDFTPGHAKHHCCFFDQKNGNYFTGDVLGNSYPTMRSAGKPLMFLCSAPADYDKDLWQASLKTIASAGAKRACICHFGIIDQIQSACDDMHRLLEMNDEWAITLVDIDDDKERRKNIEEKVWEMFWKEFDMRNTPMRRIHAMSWMQKDVHISTEGMMTWTARKRKAQ